MIQPKEKESAERNPLGSFVRKCLESLSITLRRVDQRLRHNLLILAWRYNIRERVWLGKANTQMKNTASLQGQIG